MPRFIVIPPDQVWTVQGQEQRLAFLDLVQTCWLNDQRFGMNTFAMRAQQRLEKAFSGAAIGSEVEMTDDDWALLKQVVDAPKVVLANGIVTEGYLPHRIKYILVFQDLVNAAAAEPRKTATKAEPVPLS